jgi:streptomycin 6-kinase
VSISPLLRRSVERYFGEPGQLWLDRLPSLLSEAAERWSLTLGEPYPDSKVGYVVPATRPDGSRCVLKLAAQPADELDAAVDALMAWNGRGAYWLLDFDAAARAVLLERVEPGDDLREYASRDDEAATRAAAWLMSELWIDAPNGHRLTDLRTWFSDLLSYRESHASDLRLDEGLLERTKQLTTDLIASTERPTVLHGDLHHFNILSSTRAPWLSIDPKGLVGDCGFDVAAFMRNPEPVPESTLKRRLDVFAYELDLERDRLRDWCFAEAMLNAAWSHDADPARLRQKLEWATLMLRL